MPLSQVIAHYRRRPVTVREAAILIRINRLYRPGMTAAELYDATRRTWKVGPKRERAKFALAVFEGIVREVYEITQWLPSGSTFSSRRDTPGHPSASTTPEWTARRTPACHGRQATDRRQSRAV